VSSLRLERSGTSQTLIRELQEYGFAEHQLFFDQVGRGKLGLEEGRFYPHIMLQPVITLAQDCERALARAGLAGSPCPFFRNVHSWLRFPKLVAIQNVRFCRASSLPITPDLAVARGRGPDQNL
jgi:hypothetical protein